MKRKKLWMKISYITVSGVLAATVPAVSLLPVVSAVAEDGQGAGEKSQEPSEKKTEKETEKPTEKPTEKQTESESQPESQPQSEPQTDSEPMTDPVETDTPKITEPETESQAQSDVETNVMETETNVTEMETNVTETVLDTTPETESDKQTEKKEKETEEKETEDHSILNANWETNIIASNASYLGQLSSAYGISISGDFTGVCEEVEKAFAAKLSDPEQFHATNWRDVLAVYIYELKQQTGSANISANSRKLLMEVFTEMNGPEDREEETVKVPDISEVFVEEYPIDEEMEIIDREEEIMLSANGMLAGDTDILADAYVRERADEAREALREEQKAHMDAARQEKWERLKKEAESQQKEAEKKTRYSSADMVSRTIADYVKEKGLSAKARAEIERYGSVECLQLCAIASADPKFVRASVGNNVSEERVRIVTAAYSLVGKVGYFWGGKSYAFGWDSRWGSPATVTASGSTSTGMTRNYGLDCSGFTLYCYYNGLGGSDAGIGGHTTSQWNASVMVDQVNAQPGDLVFYGGPERGDNNHVGVVVGKSSDGGLIVAHCSSSMNGVVVGEAWSSGFRHVRTVPSLA